MLLKSHSGARFYEIDFCVMWNGGTDVPLHGTHMVFMDDLSENLDWFIAHLVLVVS